MKQHLIHRQILDLRLDSKANAFQIQEQFRDWYRQQFLPVLEEVFAQISGGRNIRVDQLNFDFGRLNAEFTSLSRHALRELIMDQLIQQLPELFDQHYPKKSGIVQIVEDNYSRFEAFQFFLQNGRLPWWQSIRGAGVLDELLDAVVQNNRGGFIRFFNLQWNETIQKRLIKQYQPKQIFRLLGLVNPIVAGEVKTLFEVWESLETSGNWMPAKRQARSFDLRFFIPVLIELLQQENEIAFAPVLEKMIRLRTEEAPPSLLLILTQLKSTLQREWTQLPWLLNAVDQLIETQKSKSITGQAIQFREASLKNSETEETWKDTENTEENSKSDPLNSDSRQNESAAQKIIPLMESIGAEGILVEKAGLVLLWPYLGRFFRQLGLLEGLEFKDEMAQERALLLTYYLAEETETAAEYLMLIPKLLCSWPLHLPVDRQLNISDEEKAEVEDLLASVIANWPAVKNTSVAGFQKTFLDRKGKLFIKEEKIELLIERKGVDVLLEKLPWSLSSFKLPWMEKPIFVEW